MRGLISLLSFLVILSGAAGPAHAQGQLAPEKPLQTISLKDGTVLKGNLSSVGQDYYIIQTLSMGSLKVPVNDVVSILNSNLQQNSLNLSSGQLNAGNLTAALQGMGYKGNPMDLASDPAVMSGIDELLKDPHIMDLLQDPSLMQDIMSMDPQKIQGNAIVQELLKDPKMQGVIQQVGGKIKSSGTGLNAAHPAP